MITTEIGKNGGPLLKAANPQASYLHHKAEIDQAIIRVLQGPTYILGPYVRTFEKNFGRAIGGECVGVGCGTDALIFSLLALGIDIGDEVIVGAYVPLPVVAAIIAVGATPRIVDVKKADLTIDPSRIRIQEGRTKAIIAVHIFGNSCDMGLLMSIAEKTGVPVIEDVSQATGGYWQNQPLGSIGNIAAFSFYPTKPLGAIGDAGAVVTKDPRLANAVRQMRQYGWNQERIAQYYTGTCSRLDEIQAAVLTVKLEHLEETNASRAYVAEIYRQHTRSFECCHGARSIYHQFVIRSPQRDNLRTFLYEHSINTSVHYPVLPWQHLAYAPYCILDNCPVATRASRKVLSLPLWDGMPLERVERVCEEVNQWKSQ